MRAAILSFLFGAGLARGGVEMKIFTVEGTSPVRVEAHVPGGGNKLPVLLYAPGWGGGAAENRELHRRLAEAGFVVLALDRGDHAAPVPFDFSTMETASRFERAADAELELGATDLLAVYEALRAGRLPVAADAERAGVFGYSFGGAVAAEALRREPQLRAGANLDGALFGRAAAEGAGQPFLFVTDATARPTDTGARDSAEARHAKFLARSFADMDRWLETHGGGLAVFEDADHATFQEREAEGWNPLVRAARLERRRNLAELLRWFFQKTVAEGGPLPGDAPPMRGVRWSYFTCPGQ